MVSTGMLSPLDGTLHKPTYNNNDDQQNGGKGERGGGGG